MRKIRKCLTMLLVISMCAVSVLPAYASDTGTAPEVSQETTEAEETNEPQTEEKESGVQSFFSRIADALGSSGNSGDKADSVDKDAEDPAEPDAQAAEAAEPSDTEEESQTISLMETGSEIPMPIASSGAEFKKEVKAGNSQEWGSSASVVPGEDYSYRISLTAGSEPMENVIIYDVLERGDNSHSSAWRGKIKTCTFTGGSTVDTQIYYSTNVTQSDLSTSSSRADLSNSTYWSKNMPSNTSNITAIALDFRKAEAGGDFTLQPGRMLRVTIDMTTNGDSVMGQAQKETSSYNSAWYTSGATTPTSGSLAKSGMTEVKLYNPDVSLSISSDPAYGSESMPAEVEYKSTVNYDICITNNESFTINDLGVEDLYGGDLMPNVDGIRYYKGSDPSQAKSIRVDTMVTHTGTGDCYESRDICNQCGKDLTDLSAGQVAAHLLQFNHNYSVVEKLMGQSISLLVKSLEPNETIHILVPTEVKQLSEKVAFSNQAKLLSISSYKGYHYSSDVCWHTSEPGHGSLSLSSSVKNDFADKDKGFTYTIHLTRYGEPVNGAQKYTGSTTDLEAAAPQDGKLTFSNGYAQITLKHGQKITFEDLLEDTSYEVQMGENEGYLASISNRQGTIGPDRESRVSVVNAYSLTPLRAELEFRGRVRLSGREYTAGDSFVVLMESEEGNAPMPGNTKAQLNPESGRTADFLFGGSGNAMTFSEPGTYHYTFKQDTSDGPIPGITYDGTIYRVEIEVVDNGDGTMTARQTEIEKRESTASSWDPVSGSLIEFRNRYSAESAGYSLTVKAELEGRSIGSHEFSFILTPGGGREYGDQNFDEDILAEAMSEEMESSNDSTGNVRFSSVMFSVKDAGDYPETGREYLFTVREKQPTEDGTMEGTPLEGAVFADGKWTYHGVTYDNQSHEIIIRIYTENVDSGEGVTQTVRTEVSGQAEAIFHNVYAPSGSFEGEDPVVVTKSVIGREWETDDSFSFVLEPSDDATETALEDGDVEVDETRIQIDYNTADHKASFGNFAFKKSGVYMFTVYEEPGGKDMIYSTKRQDIIFTVTDDYSTGTLSAEVSGNSESDLTFSNFCNPPQEMEKAYVSQPVEVTKMITGRDWTKDDSFTFYIVPDGLSTINAVMDGTVTMPGSTVTVTDDSEDHSGQFGDFVFSKAGIYTFLVYEQDPGNTDLTYSTKRQTVTFTVTENALRNRLEASVNGNSEQDLTFINIYDDAPEVNRIVVDDPVVVTKQISGREWTDDDAFFFLLTPADKFTEDAVTDGTASVPGSIASITNETQDHKFQYGDFTFTKEGTYTFNVSEVAGDSNLTYSTKQQPVIISVTATGRHGQLEATVSGNSEQELTFTNLYEPAPEITRVVVDDPVIVTKMISGREWTDEDSFTFYMEPGDDATRAAVADGTASMPGSTVTINKDSRRHQAQFGDFVFSKVGNYLFDVSEVPGESDLTYSAKHQSVLISVTDTDADGVLEASVSGNSTSDLTFINLYEKAPEINRLVVDDPIVVTKQIEGRDWTAEDIFTFRLSPADSFTAGAVADGSASMPGSTVTISNDSKGHKAEYGDFVFTKAGTYTFEVSELSGDSDLTYSTKKQPVTITVTEEGLFDKTLSATVSGNSEQELTFTNLYEKAPEVKRIVVDDPVVVTKMISGRDWTDDDSFTFRIEPGDSATEAAVADGTASMPGSTVTVNNDSKDYQAKFGDFVFSQIGTYTFDVFEEPGDSDLTYSTKRQSVSISITDADNNGILESSVSGNSTSDLTFINLYEKAPEINRLVVDDPIIVTAQVEGRDWTDTDRFTFLMEPGDDATRKAVEDGIASMPGSIVTVDKDSEGHSAKFGDFVFTSTGTYTFNISEMAGDASDLAYSDKVQTVTITVTEGGLLGNKLTAEVVGNSAEELTFINTFIEQPPVNPDDPDDPKPPVNPEEPGNQGDTENPTTPVSPSDSGNQGSASNGQTGNQTGASGKSSTAAKSGSASSGDVLYTGNGKVKTGDTDQLFICIGTGILAGVLGFLFTRKRRK